MWGCRAKRVKVLKEGIHYLCPRRDGQGLEKNQEGRFHIAPLFSSGAIDLVVPPPKTILVILPSFSSPFQAPLLLCLPVILSYLS